MRREAVQPTFATETLAQLMSRQLLCSIPFLTDPSNVRAFLDKIDSAFTSGEPSLAIGITLLGAPNDPQDHHYPGLWHEVLDRKSSEHLTVLAFALAALEGSIEKQPLTATSRNPLGRIDALLRMEDEGSPRLRTTYDGGGVVEALLASGLTNSALQEHCAPLLGSDARTNEVHLGIVEVAALVLRWATKWEPRTSKEANPSAIVRFLLDGVCFSVCIEPTL